MSKKYPVDYGKITAAHGDEDMMHEPHPIQRIENYDPNDPLPPIFEPGGGGLGSKKPFLRIEGLNPEDIAPHVCVNLHGGKRCDICFELIDRNPVDVRQGEEIDPNLQYPNRHDTAREEPKIQAWDTPAQIAAKWGRPDDKDYVPAHIPPSPFPEKPKPRPNTWLVVTCPHCDSQVYVNMEPDRDDPYDGHNTGC